MCSVSSDQCASSDPLRRAGAAVNICVSAAAVQVNRRQLSCRGAGPPGGLVTLRENWHRVAAVNSQLFKEEMVLLPCTESSSYVLACRDGALETLHAFHGLVQILLMLTSWMVDDFSILRNHKPNDSPACKLDRIM